MESFFRHSRTLLQQTGSDKRLTAADHQILNIAMLNTRDPGDAVALGIDFLVKGTGLYRSTVASSRKRLVRFGYLVPCASGRRGLSFFTVASKRADSTEGDVTCADVSCRDVSSPSVRYGTGGDVQYRTGGSVQYRTDSPVPIDTGDKETVETAPRPLNVEKPHTPKVTFEGGAFTIPDEIRTAWNAAYPDIDIAGEVAKAAAWLITNGQGKKDYGRFLTNWLSRSERWRQEREGPAEPEYTEEQLEHNRRLGEELMAEELRRHELGIPDWEECPA